MKKSELRSLIRECINEVIVEDNIAVNEIDLKAKFKQFMGTGWDKAKAEQTYNQTYAKRIGDMASKLNATPEEVKDALIKFMMDNGGLAVLGGEGKNAEWDAASKSFKRLASKTGKVGPAVYEEEK